MKRRVTAVAVVVTLVILASWGAHYADKAARPAPKVRLPTMGTAHDTAVTAREAGTEAFATVDCAVQSGETSVRSGQLVAVEMDGERVVSPAGDHRVVLTVPPGTWTISWVPTGLPVGVPLGVHELDEDEVFRCAVSTEGVPVSGRVVNPKGQPVAGARLEGCGRGGKTDDAGEFNFLAPFTALRGAERRCTLRARWEDGLLARFSDGAAVGALAPGPHTLTVDDAPVAGMGISLRDTDDGLTIGYVHPGTPAEAADLRPGDLILAVDGRDTLAMSAQEFVPHGIGAEGSTVIIEVEREGVELRKQFRRERIVRVEDTGG